MGRERQNGGRNEKEKLGTGKGFRTPPCCPWASVAQERKSCRDSHFRPRCPDPETGGLSLSAVPKLIKNI